MGNEVGIIGQMYENRTNHKIGVLESRDEKYKTLLMRDSEGNTFNINFSTFKSSWRKYAGSEIIQTSTQKEEKKSQKKEKANKAKQEVKKNINKLRKDPREKVEAVHNIKAILDGALAKNDIDIESKISYNGGIKLRYNRRNFLEVWCAFKSDRVSIYVSDALADMLTVSDEVEVKTNDSWALHTKYSIANDKADLLIDVVVEAFKAYIEADKASRENGDTEEE